MYKILNSYKHILIKASIAIALITLIVSLLVLPALDGLIIKAEGYTNTSEQTTALASPLKYEQSHDQNHNEQDHNQYHSEQNNGQHHNEESHDQHHNEESHDQHHN